MRYFKIQSISRGRVQKGWDLAADEDALARVLMRELGQLTPGAATLAVSEITEDQFRAYASFPGVVQTY